MICLVLVSKENNLLILFYFEYFFGYLYRDFFLKKINIVLKNGYFYIYVYLG